MTTLRVKHVGKFTVVSNSTICDSRLSWEARGLLVYLLSKPDDWRVRLGDLMAQGDAGERKVNRILAELKLNGYMTRTRVKTPDGRFDWDTIVFETPELAQHSIPTKRRHGTMPTLARDGSPRHGSATDGARRHIAMTDSPSTEEQSTEAGKTEKAAAASPSLRSFNSEHFAETFKREPTSAEERGIFRLEKKFGSEEVGKVIDDAASHDPERLTYPLAYLERILERRLREGSPTNTAAVFKAKGRGERRKLEPFDPEEWLRASKEMEGWRNADAKLAAFLAGPS